MPTTEQPFDVNNDDSDYTYQSNNDSDNGDDNHSTTMDTTMSDNELVRLYRDQSTNVHALLGSSGDEDDTDDDTVKQVNKQELFGLYHDQQVPIEQLAPASINTKVSHKSIYYTMARRISMGPYLIKFAVPVAVALAYVEPIFRDSRDSNQCRMINTIAMMMIKATYLVFILCAPILLINYRYKLKIDALVHDIIVELQTKRERHTKYPYICPSAAISVTHIRSSIVNPTHLSTFENWQCVEERLNAHPLLRKTMQEEQGNFIEYWEILI